jgi:MFS family permease
MTNASSATDLKHVRRAIIVCALGYFIDIFDIQLFAVLRVSSLTDLGVSAAHLSGIGGQILNMQMIGMILGGFMWGWLGDRFGRLKALYGSILIYSLGTLACSLVQDPTTYGILRFVTGFGLAGETGGAITLIAELMSREKRGWGAMVIGGFGAFGPAVAVPVSLLFTWRTTYVIAGLMGLALLILRLRLVEPEMFKKVAKGQSNRGSARMFLNPKLALLFIRGIAIGLPLIFMANLVNFFRLRLAKLF